MALQKEIWVADIIEPLFASNTFAARSINHSAFVNDKTVHVPNAGTPPTVTKNRSTFPATVSNRTDNDLDYSLAEYTTNPFTVPNAEEVELSYDKRSSILSGMRNALADAVHADILVSWAGTLSSRDQVVAATAAAFNKKSVIALKTLFDKENIPQTGRCLCLTPDYFNGLLDNLTDSEATAALSGANQQLGTLGQYMGFDLYMRSTIHTEAKVQAIAWQSDCVSRALGETKIFDDPQNPLYYGDVFSALVRAAGKAIRYDGKGVALVTTAKITA